MESELEKPSWLNNEFFQTLLRENENDPTLVVEKVDVSLAVGKGENFVSFVHKAVVAVKKGQESGQRFLIVKSLPTGEAMLTFIKEAKVFERETRIYLEILPAFQKLQEASGTAVTPLGCKCFKTSRPYTIVMEDLTRRGYKVAARQLGLDLEHCKLAIKALARFHALSLGLFKIDPKIRDAFPDTTLTRAKQDVAHHFNDRNICALAKIIETWEGYERFGERLRQSNVIDINIDLLEVPPSQFTVLNHGDCWVNNMMFKYSDQGKVEDVYFVDYQISRIVSLAFDIQLFMVTSAQAEVRSKHWDHLLEEYHEHFLATLQSIDYDISSIFTLDELKKEVEDKTVFALFISFTIMATVLANPEDSPDFSQMEEYDPSKRANANPSEQVSVMARPYSGANFKKALQSLLPKFESAGVL